MSLNHFIWFFTKSGFQNEFLYCFTYRALQNLRFRGLPEHFGIDLHKGRLKHNVWAGPGASGEPSKPYVLKGPL